MKQGGQKNGDFKKIIKEVWVEKSPERDPLRGFNGKIRRCRKVIKMWVRKTKPLTEKYIQEKTATLAKIQEVADPFNVQLERELKSEIKDLLEQEDLKW